MPTLGDVGSSCPLCGGSLKYSKKLDLQSEVDSYTELLKHVKPSELLPEGHLNWKAWAHAESCDSEAVLKGPADGWKPLAIVKVVNPGTEVCRICYRADIQGTVAAWEGHDRADVTVLETLPRYWTLVAEAARQSCPSMQDASPSPTPSLHQSDAAAPGSSTSAGNFPLHKTEDEWKSELTEFEYKVIRGKSTEPARTGEYDKFYPGNGYFVCRACNHPLYSAAAKFDSGCGWPAFDRCFKGSVSIEVDNQFGRRRVEIICANCGGHLGHVFDGEEMTATNERHCVNSVSVQYVDEGVPVGLLEDKVL